MQICNFFADSKRRAQELSIDVSFVIFGHQTWDLEGGGVSRDRVNVRNSENPWTDLPQISIGELSRTTVVFSV